MLCIEKHKKFCHALQFCVSLSEFNCSLACLLTRTFFDFLFWWWYIKKLFLQVVRKVRSEWVITSIAGSCSTSHSHQLTSVLFANSYKKPSIYYLYLLLSNSIVLSRVPSHDSLIKKLKKFPASFINLLKRKRTKPKHIKNRIKSNSTINVNLNSCLF